MLCGGDWSGSFARSSVSSKNLSMPAGVNVNQSGGRRAGVVEAVDGAARDVDEVARRPLDAPFAEEELHLALVVHNRERINNYLLG